MEKLYPFLSTIRWQDVFDITLNSYILFRLYALFRGTNVLRVLVGIAFLWFFQRIAVSVGLIVTSWAIQGITAAATLIIIVVFRNEIRSVLQAKNLKSIVWGFPHRTGHTPVETIVESVYELARERTGALIVFPGKDDLEELVHSGIPWNGLISAEMIKTVFFHDNPVHDGAAIIRGDRISEVGAILPLSRQRELPSYYGTRHRAAAGLAEATDALVVIVSEERGNVVVAKGSSIRPVNRRERLTEMLQEHLGAPSKHWGYLRREKLELGIAAFVSVLFITATWFSFTKGLDTLTTLEVPIEYMNRDPGMEILDTSVNNVKLNLSGSGALIKSLRPEQIKVRLDLSKAVVGENAFNISSDTITLPPGVFLKNVEPQSVEVTLDVPAKKEVPVQVDWVGRLSPQLLLVGAKPDPKKVEIVGGKRILDNISTIYTEKVPLDALEKSGTLTVKLALNPASLKLAPGVKDKVTVDYVVTRKP